MSLILTLLTDPVTLEIPNGFVSGLNVTG